MEAPILHRRRWYQYSLRTLFFAITLIAVGCGWFGTKMREARRQYDAVEAIRKLRTDVYYDYEIDSLGHRNRNAQPPSPEILRNLLGDDFFRTVTRIRFRAPARGLDDNLMAKLDSIPSLELLDINIYYTGGITRTGWAHLQSLNRLRILHLNCADFDDDAMENLKGLAHLQAIHIERANLVGPGLAQLEGLPHLTELGLSGWRITSSSLLHLAGSTQLRRLWLSKTKVDDAGLAYLSGLKNLEVLWLDDTDITDAGLSTPAFEVKRFFEIG